MYECNVKNNHIGKEKEIRQMNCREARMNFFFNCLFLFCFSVCDIHVFTLKCFLLLDAVPHLLHCLRSLALQRIAKIYWCYEYFCLVLVLEAPLPLHVEGNFSFNHSSHLTNPFIMQIIYKQNQLQQGRDYFLPTFSFFLIHFFQ